MRFSTPVTRRLARVGLGFATMLSFVGAMAGSALHRHPVAGGSSSAAWMAQDDAGTTSPEPGRQAPHDEQSCFLCKALSTPGLPASASAAELVAAQGFLPAPDPDQVVSFLRSASPRARAPPA